MDEAADMAQGGAQIVRDSIGKGLQFLVCRGQFLISLVEGLIDLIEGPGLAVEIGEHRDLGFQNRGIDGFGQVIHCPGAVAGQHMLVLAEMGGDKNDRDILGFLALFDDLGQLEPVGARHLHIQDDQGNVGVEKGNQSFLRGHGFRQAIVGSVENGFENHEVLRLVIHQQYVDWIRHGGWGPSGFFGL